MPSSRGSSQPRDRTQVFRIAGGFCTVWAISIHFLSFGLARWYPPGNEFTCQWQETQETGFYPWVGKIPWSRKWQSTPVFVPGKFHEQRSLEGFSHGVAQSQTQLSLHTHMGNTHTHTHTYTQRQHNTQSNYSIDFCILILFLKLWDQLPGTHSKLKINTLAIERNL